MWKHKSHTRLRQREGSAKLTLMPAHHALLAAALTLVLACGTDSAPPPETPNAFAVFPNLPLPPGAKFISRAGSPDALQITLFSPAAASSVLEYYRGVLGTGKWRLISDMKKPDGTVVLYAEREGPPLWVSIRPTSDSAGTMVQLAGAVVGGADSANAAAPKREAAQN